MRRTQPFGYICSSAFTGPVSSDFATTPIRLTVKSNCCSGDFEPYGHGTSFGCRLVMRDSPRQRLAPIFESVRPCIKLENVEVAETYFGSRVGHDEMRSRHTRSVSILSSNRRSLHLAHYCQCAMLSGATMGKEKAKRARPKFKD